MGTQAEQVREGLEGVVAFATEIAEPDRDGGALRYRGVDLRELAGVVPLWQSYDFFVKNEDLANYGAWGFQSKDWTKIGYVTGSAKLEG